MADKQGQQLRSGYPGQRPAYTEEGEHDKAEQSEYT